MTEIRDPVSGPEWQNAVDAATGSLAFQAARDYGLIDGGPEVNVERCEHLIAEGFARRVYPSDDAIERFTLGLVAAALSR